MRNAQVDCRIDHQVEVPDWDPYVEGAMKALIRGLGVARMLNPLPHPFEVSVVFSDDARVRELNKRYRGQDKATNILSFPLMDGPFEGVLYLGDLILAYETVQREAEEKGCAPQDHIAHLLVHGALHLFGHDHETPESAKEMEHWEAQILATMGIPNPYDSQ